MSRKVRKAESKGFTLIELLVVISIIALLLSILMPSLSKVREQCKGIVCLVNEKTVGLGMILYAEDNRGILPPLSDLDNSAPDRRWYGLIIPFISQPQIVQNGTTKTDYFRCPSRREKPRELMHSGGIAISCVDFGVNYGGSSGLFSYTRSNHPSFTPNLTKIDKVKRPSSIFMAMDSSVYQSGAGSPYNFAYYVYAPYTPEYPNGTPWSLDMDYDKDGMMDSNINVFNSTATERPHNGSSHRHRGGGSIVSLLTTMPPAFRRLNGRKKNIGFGKEKYLMF